MEMKCNSLLAWQGGKSRLAHTIIERMPEHTTYCEVFAGAAWVLFGKAPSKAEIINDINRELVTLYRCVQHHLPALAEQFRWMLVAREEFDRFMATPVEVLTDIQRAARFFYVMKTSFGAKVRGPTFGATHTQPPRLNLLRIEEDLSAAHLRLARVLVECRPWSEVIDRFDSAGTLFYLDPPYWGCENDYGLGLFERDDFARMAEQLTRVKGRFILSLNDTPGVREVFARFHIESVKTRYSINSNVNDRGKAVPEVLITNYR
mgnify:CR=1 FL=1